MKCGLSRSTTRTPGKVREISSDADRGTTRSSPARRYSTGTVTLDKHALTSADRTARIRARQTGGLTLDMADESRARRAEDPNRPSSTAAATQSGTSRTGSILSKERSKRGTAIGLRTKEQTSTTPHKPAGLEAASETATGPENDSPTKINGHLVGSAARASASSSG